MLMFNRKRNGISVDCYIRQDVSYNIKDVFPSTIENIFVNILLPKTKRFTVGIIYRSPNQNNFLEDIKRKIQ